jgi:hypothetical protein
MQLNVPKVANEDKIVEIRAWTVRAVKEHAF